MNFKDNCCLLYLYNKQQLSRKSRNITKMKCVKKQRSLNPNMRIFNVMFLKLMLVSCTEWNVFCFFLINHPLWSLLKANCLPSGTTLSHWTGCRSSMSSHGAESLQSYQFQIGLYQKRPHSLLYINASVGPVLWSNFNTLRLSFCFVDSNPSLWCRHLVQTILFIPLFILPLTLYVSAYTNNNFCIKRF